MNEEWLEGMALILFMHLLLFQILLSGLFIDCPVDLQKNNTEAKMNSRMSHEPLCKRRIAVGRPALEAARVA